MRGFALVLASILATAVAVGTASAGRISGDIQMAGKAVPAGMLVTIAPAPPPPPAKGEAPKPEPAKPKPAPPPDSTTTDKFGSYKFMVKGEGKYTLTVLLEKQTASIEVFSSKDPTRYDLILEKKDDKLTVKRK